MAPLSRVSGRFLEPRFFSARLPHRRKVLFQSSLVPGRPVLHRSLTSHLPNLTLQPLFTSGVCKPQRSPGSYPHKPDPSHHESLIKTRHRVPPAPRAVVHLWAHRGHLERQLRDLSALVTSLPVMTINSRAELSQRGRTAGNRGETLKTKPKRRQKKPRQFKKDFSKNKTCPNRCNEAPRPGGCESAPRISPASAKPGLQPGWTRTPRGPAPPRGPATALRLGQPHS